MDILQRNLPLRMVREGLESIPRHLLPEGYGISWYRPGDEAHWLAIHREADLYNDISMDLYRGQFGHDPGLLADRQAYLRHEAEGIIGTATAWFDPAFRGESWGRLHWVAILPGWQGKGLAKPLLTVVCDRLRELGHGRAFLTTSTVRVAAIHLYLQYGFLPGIENADDLRTWRALRPHLRPRYRSLLPDEGTDTT